MPTVDLPGMRSISTDSACIARQRSSARPVILLYFTPGVRLELVGRDDGTGMDLHDRALDRELAALLFKEPRALHQLALVDLALALWRVQQREWGRDERPALALGRQLLRLRRERQ